MGWDHMTKPIAQVHFFDSSSSSKKYQTLEYEDGTTSCDCPGWTRRIDTKGRRSCKHTRQVEAQRKGTPVLVMKPAQAAALPSLGQRKFTKQ